MIEFYSMQEDDSTRFIARYYVETFLDRKDHHGLSLYVGDASYDLTAANCNEVARELPVEDLRDALAESAEVLALAKRQDGGASVFRVKVRRVLVETAHIVVEAADEDEAGEMAIEQAQFGGAEWTADSCDDSCFEVSETEEVEEN